MYVRGAAPIPERPAIFVNITSIRLLLRVLRITLQSIERPPHAAIRLLPGAFESDLELALGMSETYLSVLGGIANSQGTLEGLVDRLGSARPCFPKF